MIPHAFDILEPTVAARSAAGHLLLGLDFDGTLAPIVPVPENAAMPESTRDVLKELLRRGDTWVAVLSGRGLADITRRVGLDTVYYAGNHGLEIDGPDVRRVHQQAESTRDLMGELAVRLEAALRGLHGIEVEDKGLSLSVHYRRAPDEATGAEARRIVEETSAPYRNVVLTYGKRVVEVRPAVDWNKGHALRFLRQTIAGQAPGTPTLFIGDDRTDEDGYREVGEPGYGIVVADPVPADTNAHAYLRSLDEVTTFLQRLAGDRASLARVR